MDVVPVVGHGTLPLGTIAGWLCTVMSGSGLSPPVASSVEPSGTPSRPTLDCEPMLGDEADAVALDDAAAVVEQVPDAVPDMPAPSNSAVGADVPEIAPIAEVSPLIEPSVPAVELPAPPVEHAVADAIAPGDDGLIAVGLTPGVASSVAPSGIPVVPTGAAAPNPSGEVRPSGGATGAMPTCADAEPTSNSDQTMATIRMRFMGCVPLLSRAVRRLR
jgi:hypothetical protein